LFVTTFPLTTEIPKWLKDYVETPFGSDFDRDMNVSSFPDVCHFFRLLKITFIYNFPKNWQLTLRLKGFVLGLRCHANSNYQRPVGSY